MALELANYEDKARLAVRTYWSNREKASQAQGATGSADRGERTGVTSGKNMDGFIDLIREIVHANGPQHSEIHVRRSFLTLPGYFRPTKVWDLLITAGGELVAALELKSQVGPSFGNNYNNRVEEAIGLAQDFWTAFREGAFGDRPRPFIGWMILVEDTEKSRTPVRHSSRHFQTFPDFDNTSYLDRYDILCRKLVREQLYSAAALVVSPRSAIADGTYSNLSEMTALSSFIAAIAGHVATSAALSD